MKTTTKLVLVAAVAALAVTPLLAKSGGRQGTNILHFTVRVPLTLTTDGSAESPSATGTVTATEAMQGSADHESLTVSAKGLNAGEAYDIVGISNSTPITAGGGPFTANSKGGLTVKFGASKKSSSIFADATQLQEVDVVNNTNSATVLTANFTNATTLQFMVKQDISTNDGVSVNTTATLSVSSRLNKGTSKSSVTVTASGLTTGADYVLVLNGTPVATNTATSKHGNLKITSTDTPPNILDLTSVVVTDTNGSPVTATATLP